MSPKMLPAPASLAEAAVAILATADPEAKVRLSREIADAWRAGRLPAVGLARPPSRPARPPRPLLRPPGAMPRRRAGRSRRGRIALLHAIAHIELNAIDLAWDLVARFTHARLPRAFYDDWVRVGEEEARHFALVSARLADFGAAYGDLPAHDGLWEAATATAGDPAARLAVVPMVLEARGLDVTPGMIARLRRFGDAESAAVLGAIYKDEIGHVACGVRWFTFLCRRRGLEPAPVWHALVGAHFQGTLKPPFNTPARRQAGMSPDFCPSDP